tara:strand:- start:338 stop:559 length:222 start_codon:yes stop_codon:yes gene_type:complete
MTNITVLQSEIDLFLDGVFQVYVSAGDDSCVSLYDAGGCYLATLDEEYATFEYISQNESSLMTSINDPRNYRY